MYKNTVLDKRMSFTDQRHIANKVPFRSDKDKSTALTQQSSSLFSRRSIGYANKGTQNVNKPTLFVYLV